MDQAGTMAMVSELEVEMMQDMFKRMTRACQEKCISPSYREAELSKGESVCLDRCVAKYMDVHDKLGKKLTQYSVQDEAQMTKLQATNTS